MSVLTLAEVATYLGVPEANLPGNAQAILDEAELLVAGSIGAQTLEQQSFTETVIVPRSKDRILVDLGPIFEIDSCNVAGATVDPATLVLSPWSYKREEGFGMGQKVVTTYKGGWADSTEIPSLVQQAVLMTYKRQANGAGSDVSSESIGDYSITYAGRNFNPQALPADIRSLLVKWRKPGFGIGP